MSDDIDSGGSDVSTDTTPDTSLDTGTECADLDCGDNAIDDSTIDDTIDESNSNDVGLDCETEVNDFNAEQNGTDASENPESNLSDALESDNAVDERQEQNGEARDEQKSETAPPGYTTEQWGAFQNLNKYQSKHNYGMGDFDSYSKDPEWQKLNNDYLTASGQEPIDYSGNSETPPESRTDYNEVSKPTDKLDKGFEKQSKSDAKDLSWDEKKAFENYAGEKSINGGTDYRTMNDILRGNDTSRLSSYQREQSNKDIGLMKDALDRKELPQDTQLYRGLNNPKSIFGEGYANKTPQELADSVKGKEFCEDGFLSTSTDKDSASQFAHSWDGAVMNINAPKGANGMCMGEVNGFKGEKEFLMPPGTTYRVDNAYQDPYGHWQFDTTITGRRK